MRSYWGYLVYFVTVDGQSLIFNTQFPILNDKSTILNDNSPILISNRVYFFEDSHIENTNKFQASKTIWKLLQI